MPLPSINFAHVPIQKPDYSALENFVPGIWDAYTAGKQRKSAAEMAAEQKNLVSQKAESERIANALMSKYGEQEKLAKLAFLQAQTGHQGALTQRAMQGGMGSGNNSEQAHSLRVWNSLPADNKRDAIATAVGMGYTPDEAAFALSAGKSLRDLAKAMDMDVSQVEKSYSPTVSNITSLKNAEGGAAELDYLSERANEAMAPYSRKFFGYSPEQVVGALSGEDNDSQARFLAGRALQPEIAAGRSRVAMGSNAHDALKQVQADALGSSKIYEALVSPEVYQKTQNYINEWLQGGLKERKNAVHNIKRFQKPNSESQDSYFGSGPQMNPEMQSQRMIQVRNKRTGETKMIPANEAQQFGGM